MTILQQLQYSNSWERKAVFLLSLPLSPVMLHKYLGYRSMQNHKS